LGIIPPFTEGSVKMGDLARFALECGSDKVPICDLYEAYLSPLRHGNIRFFEIGVGGYDDPQAGGASVRMWKRYFSKAEIYALDYYDKSPHAETRITIFRGSQDDALILNRIADEIGSIDVILDDGSHVSAHVIRSFEVLFPRLNPGGLYIVEDLGTAYWPEFGGSVDLDDPNTSINYFRKIVHGLNHLSIRDPYTPSYADENVEFMHFYPNFVVIKKRRTPELIYSVPEIVVALENANGENGILRAECANLQSKLAQREAEYEALAAAAKRWFEAVIAVTDDHNPLAQAGSKCFHWSRTLKLRNRIVLADRAREAGNWELAVRYYRDALDHEPQNPEIWVQLGDALKSTGKTGESELAYQWGSKLVRESKGI